MASHLTYFLLWRRCPYVQRFPAWWNICSLKCLRGKFLNLSAILKYIGSSLWSFVYTANNAGFLVQLRALAPVIHSKWKSHETWNLNFVWSRKTNGILDHLEIFEYKSQTIFLLMVLLMAPMAMSWNFVPRFLYVPCVVITIFINEKPWNLLTKFLEVVELFFFLFSAWDSLKFALFMIDSKFQMSSR